MLTPGHVNRKNLLKEMNIKNFNYMTVDDVITLANRMPNMDRELARQVISEFPDFVQDSKMLVSSMKENVDLAFSANRESMMAVYDSCNRTLDYCFKRLESNDITEEERNKLMEMVLDVNEMMRLKDTENKEFISDIIGKGLSVLGAVAVGVVTILGAASQIKGHDISNEDEQKYDYEE